MFPPYLDNMTREGIVDDLRRIAREYRRGYPPRRGSIGRAVARMALRKAKLIRVSPNWKRAAMVELSEFKGDRPTGRITKADGLD